MRWQKHAARKSTLSCLGSRRYCRVLLLGRKRYRKYSSSASGRSGRE